MLSRCGWAFVCIDHTGRVIARAYGVPPPWIVDIPGAESWALLQALHCSEPGSEFRLDCKPVWEVTQRRAPWAVSPKRPHARVNALVLTAADDTPASAFDWMPAHTSAAMIGLAQLASGQRLTRLDRDGNNLADESAKAGAEEHRVSAYIREAIARLDARVANMAKWLGHVTFAASNSPSEPHRDSMATRAPAATAAARRQRQRDAGAADGNDGPPPPPPRLPDIGHVLIKITQAWACTTCRR